MLSRLKYLALAVLLLVAPAHAFFHRSLAVVTLPGGIAQLNLGGNEITNAQNFTNLWDSSSYGFFNGQSPGVVNSDGFPIANWSSPGSISGAISNGSAPLISVGPYTWSWDAGVSCFRIVFLSQGATSTGSTNATVTNGSGSGHFTVQGDCVHAGSVTFSWVNTNSTVTWSFDSTYTQWASNSSGRMWMCRNSNVGWNGLDDCTAYQAGTYWTQEFVNLVKSLNPSYIRTMGWNLRTFDQTSTATKWAYRGNPSTMFSMSGMASSYPVGARAGGGPTFGSITGSGGQYTAAAATDTPLSGWINGEVLIGAIAQGAGGLQISGVVPGVGNNCKVSVTTVSTTGTTNGTTSITGVASTTGVYNGMPIYAADIPAGAVVESFVANTSITLNIAATGSNSGETLTLGTVTGIQTGPVYIDNVTGTTEVNGVQTVTAVDAVGNTFTINTGNACAGTFTGSGGRIAYQTLSITGKTGGSKLIVQLGGFPVSSGGGASDDLKYILPGTATFIYSSILDRVVYTSSGVTTSVPPEAQIQLANLVGAGLWWNYGSFATDDYITQLGTLAQSTLTGIFGTELCNEIWNGTFFCGEQEGNLGVGAGFFNYTSSGFPQYQELRTIQVGNILEPIFGGSSHPKYQNLFMFQGGSGLGNFTAQQFLNGSGIGGQIGTSGAQTSGSPNITVASTDGLFPGETISGSGVSGTISTVTAPNAVTLSANATTNNTANTYTFSGGIGTSRYQTYIGAISFTGTTHSNTIVDGLSSVSSLVVGDLIADSGVNIPAAATIATINSGCTSPCITISANALASASTTIKAIPNYAASPNRPVDWTDAMGYAPYLGATSLCGQNPDAFCTPTTFDLPNLIAVADNYIAGNTATAFTDITNLVLTGTNRSQTVTCTGTTFTTPLAHNFSAASTLLQFSVSGGTTYSGLNPQTMYRVDSANVSGANTFTIQIITNGSVTGSDVNCGTAGSGTTTVGAVPGNAISLFGLENTYYTKYQSIAAGFSPSPAHPLSVEWYEGAPEITAPSTAQATSIGLVTPSTPATTTGTTHGTTVIDSIASLSNVFVGEVASATDITTGQLIVSINSGCPTTCTGNYVVLSAVATGSNSGESVTFTGTAALANSTLTAAVVAYKLSLPDSSTAMQAYYNVFMGTVPGWLTNSAMPNSAGQSNLILLGGSVWALTGNLTSSSPQVYGFFCGFQKVNGAAATNGC